MQHPGQGFWDDLPGNAELVLQPTALYGLAAIGCQGIPESVYFRLIPAQNGKGDRFVERIMRPAI
jgi:hypothetical protein